MDYNPYQAYNYRQPQQPATGHIRSFEIAALVMSIISLALCCCFYLSLPCGALAVIFASLSRGKESHKRPMATVAFVIGIVGLVCTALFLVYAFYIFFTEFGSMEEVLEFYSQYMGIDYDELYDLLYGSFAIVKGGLL